MGMEQRDSVVRTFEGNNQKWEDYMKEGKAFHISQMEVLNAYKAVKANKGAGGVDTFNPHIRLLSRFILQLTVTIFVFILFRLNIKITLFEGKYDDRKILNN